MGLIFTVFCVNQFIVRLKTLYALVFLLILHNAKTQEMVPNGGFEEHRGKGHSMYWTQAEGEFNHFYHKHVSPKFGGAAQGEGYHCLCMYSMEPNEFMHVALKSKLEKNKIYTISMNVRISNSADEVYKNDNYRNLNYLDWYFTGVPLNVLSKLLITAEPSISFPFEGAHVNWENLSKEYIAKGDEEFLTIGNITRMYNKIRAEEKIDSLENEYEKIDLREKAECDSIRNIYANQLIRNENYNQDDFSINPYVKKKTKKISRKKRKKFEKTIEHNRQVGLKIGTAQEVVRKRYKQQKWKIEVAVENEKKQFAVNICFDDISIVATEKVSSENISVILPNEISVGSTIVLKNIQFQTGNANLKESATNTLNELLKWLQKNKNVKIQISGHTDNQGDEKSNDKLSLNRAKAVADFLIENGINSARLKWRGYAARYALADNTTEFGRALNRRVEITIMGE